MTTKPDHTPTRPPLSRRDPSGRFQASTPLHELLDGVAEVARLAAEQAGCLPEQVSKGAWDRGRAAAGRGDLPTAEGVRKRVGRAWPDVLQVALNAPAGRVYRLGVLSAHRTSGDDERLTIPSVRWVALQIGHSPRPGEYDLTISDWNSRALTDPQRPMLPVSKTIRARMPWADAIHQAGLPPLGKSWTKRAQPLTELIDRCITDAGVVPTKNWFRQWARINDIRVGNAVTNQWRHNLEEALRVRRERGDPIPDKAPLPVLPAAPSRRPCKYTRTDAIRSLRVYGRRYLPVGGAPRYGHYQVCSTGDPDLISTSNIAEFGLFQDLCREAGL
jgi:hypothetical protein